MRTSNFHKKTHTGYLTGLFLTGIVILAVSGSLDREVRKPNYPEMVLAAERTAKAFETIEEVCATRDIAIDPLLDPNRTGLIGLEFSPITTTLGNLSAKQTSLNPDFGALIRDIFDSQKLKAGDRIAIQASASFPALTIATIIACETIELVPVLSVSLGSSSFGANRPELTYLDLEMILHARGVIQTTTGLVTPGGENDNGSSFPEGGFDIVANAAKRNGYDIFVPADLDDAIRIKWGYFHGGPGVKLFINIGGNQTAFGGRPYPSGLIEPAADPDRPAGNDLAARFLNAGIPVLNLLDIRDLALRHQILVSPQPLPEPGKSGLYTVNHTPAIVWWMGLAIMLSGMILIGIKKVS